MSGRNEEAAQRSGDEDGLEPGCLGWNQALLCVLGASHLLSRP